MTLCVSLYGVDYTGISDSSYISGQKITPEDLKGKVVFFEYWGYKCGPCRASLPRLQELWEKYGKTGKFIVVGSHCQNRDDASIKQCLSNAGVTFPVYQFIYNSLARSKGGIPFAVLIDHKGELVKAGGPTGLYELVDDLVKKAPDVHFIFGAQERSYGKVLARSFVDGRNLESAFASLKKKSESGDANAQEYYALAEKWRKDYISSVHDAVKSTPSLALMEIVKYKTMFPSDKEFDSEMAELKSNKNVMLLAQARRNFEAEELRYRKKPKQSKAQSKRFSALVLLVDKIEDPLLDEEKASLKARIEALADASSPDK